MNEFNPDYTATLELVEFIKSQAMRIEELESRFRSLPDHASCPFCQSNHVPHWLHDINMDFKNEN